MAKITFRDYEDLIRSKISDMDARDPNWKWSLHSLGANRVRVRWGYLDYLENKNNCFIMELEEYDEEFDETELSVYTPDHDDFINLRTLIEDGADLRGRGWQEHAKQGILRALEEMEYYAHSRY